MHVILRLNKVKERTGKSKSAIYREIKEGSFPSQYRIGRASVGWLESDILSWQEKIIRQKKAANDNKVIC